MKKIIPIAVIVCLIIAAGVFAAVNLNKAPEQTANPSRRDGEILAQGDGVIGPSADFAQGDGVVGPSGDKDPDAAAFSSHIEAEKNEIDVAEITSDTNEPVSGEVEAVSTLILSEAVKIEEGDPEAFYSNDDFADVIPSDYDSFSAEEIPEKYDSRNVNGKSHITEIEDQGYSYLCWSYAALAAVEGDILSHHDDIDYKKLNLSEKHLAYYNIHRCDGSTMGLIDGDYRELINADNEENAWIFDYDTNYIAMGGVSNYCLSVLTAWKGPVIEKGDDDFKSIYGEKFLFKDNGNAPSDAYNSDYHVQDVIEIPASFENRDMIKKMIMEHGAVTASVNSDDIYWKGRKKNLYSSFGGGEVPTADHEIAIVGWDDSYSASNFAEKPPEDGAFICRNSWGSTLGEKGYFYLSYYDETVADNIAAAYSCAVKGEDGWYDNNYQVCGFIDNIVSALDDSQNYVTAYSASGNPYGLLYEAVSDETLEAVGFMSLDTYQQCEIKVYLNPQTEKKDEGSSISLSNLKEPVSSFKASNIAGGYHTYELSEPVELSEGDTFFILVKPVTKGRLVYERADTNTGTANYDEWNNLTGNVHNNYEASGRSYYISDDYLSMDSQSDKDFFIKAYTNNK